MIRLVPKEVSRWNVSPCSEQVSEAWCVRGLVLEDIVAAPLSSVNVLVLEYAVYVNFVRGRSRVPRHLVDVAVHDARPQLTNKERLMSLTNRWVRLEPARTPGNLLPGLETSPR